jgi:hypothetical protein
MLSSHLRLGLPSGPPNQNPVNISPVPMRATCPAYLSLLDLVTLTVLGEVHHYEVLLLLLLLVLLVLLLLLLLLLLSFTD